MYKYLRDTQKDKDINYHHKLILENIEERYVTTFVCVCYLYEFILLFVL